ncbi:MAG TPA: hypothetical protein VH761_16700 [Ilumatobacteraceae bacterium]|jgi:hypothetical protein
MAETTASATRRHGPRIARLLAGAATLALSLTSCDLIRDNAAEHHHADADDVAAVAGWTRIALTPSYLLVVNVLPSEAMYTDDEMQAMSPTEGEAILDGPGEPVGLGVRHVEAHIYDRRTGIPLSNVEPTIRVFNRTTGDRVEVAPTLMQDVIIGGPDIHYGNNVAVRGDSDISVQVAVGDEEVTVDGHLD